MRTIPLITPFLAMLMALSCTTACTSPAQTKARNAQDEQAIRASLTELNAVLARRDLPAFMALFDDSDNIMLVGSDVGEIYRGRKEVAGFLEMLFKMPFVFSFEMKQVTIAPGGTAAWAFMDGAMVHTGATGKVRKIPYRFALALVKKDEHWRWQLFQGSIPRGE